MNKLFLDVETRSELNLQEVGAWRYARHPSTDVLCAAVQFSDWSGPEIILPRTVHPTDKFFSYLRGHIQQGGVIVAHNAHFEYAIAAYILHKRYGWPALIDPKYWGCTMARAFMCNLPATLDGAAKALKLPVKKDMEGKKLMLEMCKPLSVDALGFPTYKEDPASLQRLYQYCKVDVETEIELDKRLPELPPHERKIWELDLKINSRGVTADIPTAGKAMDLASSITAGLNKKLYELTGGAVSAASRVAEIKRYLASQGVVVNSLDKAAVVKLLENPTISQRVKDVVKIRQQVGKSSTAKYETILSFAAEDNGGRMRGLLQYHAAGTGRWGGRGPQPQNFPKGIGYDAPAVCEDVAAMTESAFVTKYGDKSMDALSAALRGVLMAGKDNVLIAADYNAIEARVLLWLAGDELALGKYRMGINLYVDMARWIYKNPELTKKNAVEYAIGKAAILGCGYGMGAEKFRITCAAPPYSVDISEEMAVSAIKTYRDKYKPVVSMWYAQEKAAKNAVLNPGSVHPCGRVVWGMDRAREFLVCKLPSGRHLRYFKPSVKTIDSKWGEKQELHFWAGYSSSDKKYAVAVDPVPGLGQYKTYGGSLVENITQAVARDFMAHGMQNVEAAGYPVVLTVHDEVVAEIDLTKYLGRNNRVSRLPSWDETPVIVDPNPAYMEDWAVKDFEKVLCQPPAWGADCPLAAEGWIGKRYRK